MNLALNEADDLNISWNQFKVQKEMLNENYKSAKLVGDIILERQQTLLGHVLRMDTNDLMRQVTCDENLQRPYALRKKTGGPRLNWWDDNINRAFMNHGNGDAAFDVNNPEHVELIKKAADDYKF